MEKKSSVSDAAKAEAAVCDYFDRPLVMSFWFTKGGSQCIDQQDVFDDVALGYKRRLGALSINVRDDRDDVRSLIEEHGWKVPAGYDRDGAVSNIYRVGGCPTFIYVRKGGVMKNALAAYGEDVKAGRFPADSNCYS